MGIAERKRSEERMHEGILDLAQEQGGTANQIKHVPLRAFFFSHVAVPNFGIVPDGRFF
jgi:hypothetical protein